MKVDSELRRRAGMEHRGGQPALDLRGRMLSRLAAVTCETNVMDYNYIE